MPRRLLAMITTLGALAMTACGGFGTCESLIAGGLIVHVKDAGSGADICDATVTATDIATHKSYPLVTALSCRYSGVGAGTFDVTAEKAGYISGHVSGIRVQTFHDSCGFELRDNLLTLELTPAP